MKYRIFWTNFGYFAISEFDTFGAARAYGVSKCFEHSIYYGDKRVGSWTTFGGWRDA